MNNDGDLDGITRRGKGKNAIHGGSPLRENLPSRPSPRLLGRAKALLIPAIR